jgi:hypothetical protein
MHIAAMHAQRNRTLQERTTSLPPADVLAAARTFFGPRNGVYAAFPEREGPNHLVLRGQGGEEVVLAANPTNGATLVTGSSYLFDQQIARFLSTLPPAAPVSAP